MPQPLLYHTIPESPTIRSNSNVVMLFKEKSDIVLEMPKEITVKFDKIFSLMSANYGLLLNLATIIRSYRLPDSYKEAGQAYSMIITY